MREGREAVGFCCPICSHDRAQVVEVDLPRIVLRCSICEEVWVEAIWT